MSRVVLVNKGLGTATARRSAKSIVHNDVRTRIIAVRKLVNDNMKNEFVLFLISAYAPIEYADQKLCNCFIEKLEFCISRKHLVISELVLILKTIYAETKLALKLAELD